MTGKTILGAVIALGALADLFLLRHAHVALTREDVLVHGAFLLFAGMLIDPADFKALAFWRKSE